MYRYLALLLLIVCSLEAYAAGDSTKIGISVTIKASQQCDYEYSLAKQADSNNYYSRSTSCDIRSSKLQQHLEQVAYSNTKIITKAQTEEKRYRVLMTVQ